MKYLLLCLLAAACVLCSCSNGSDAANDTTGNQTSVESAAETEAAGDALYIDVSSGGYEFGEYYKEAATQKDGDVKLFSGSESLSISYQSVFYGSDSGINRDYISYCESFDRRISTRSPSFDRFCVADFGGARYGELLWLAGGNIKIINGSRDGYYDETDAVTVAAGLSVSASLEGAGDFDGNGFYDLVVADGGSLYIYFGAEGGFTGREYGGFPQSISCADINGDGLCDIVAFDADAAHIYLFDGFSFASPVSYVYTYGGDYVLFACADLNTDGYADLAAVTSDNELVTLFGFGDCTFGPSSANSPERNTYALFDLGEFKASPSFITCGDVDGDGVPDICGVFEKEGKSYVYTLVNSNDGAYDYSLHLLKTDDGYLMYSGCRWYEKDFADGDHIMLSRSSDGVTWRRYLLSPMFYLGRELGESGWWTDNTLEPEVIIVDGVYHMYWQCSYSTPKGNYGDKIGYAVSEDGVTWERKTDEPVIICGDDEIGFNHEEVIYVADDPDGKCWWMYTGHFVNGVFSGHIRIRSAVPDRFDYADSEPTSGMAQLGNQIGYFDTDSGRRVFLRITFTDAGEHTVPVFNFSDDGLDWSVADGFQLASVDTSDKYTSDNSNVYFLGMSTINGTGEIERAEDGSYRLVYAATTCASSVSPEIFSAEAGVGTLVFTVN